MDCNGKPTSKMRFFEKLQKGALEDGDCGHKSEEKPPWMDKEKLKRVKAIYEEHSPGILLGHFMGQSIMSQVPSLAQLVVYTGKHSTKPLATKRAVMTVGYVVSWYKGRIWDPEDSAYKSIQTVRAMHKTAQTRISKDRPRKPEEGPWLSQFDMALTQFAFFGPLVLYGDKIGLFCTLEELDCLVHFWRYVAYLLGAKDEYNLGSVEYDELVETCKDIAREVAIPAYTNPTEEITATTRIATEGYSYLNRFIQHDAMHNFTCELLEIETMYRPLDWFGHISSWFFWLSTKLFRFQSARLWLSPGYDRALEYKIKSFLKNPENVALIDEPKESGQLLCS